MENKVQKGDLQCVLVNGILVAILGGILGGALDYFTSMINLPLAFGIIVVVMLIIMRVRKSYYRYHVLYSVLSLLFLLIGMFFQYFMERALYYIMVVQYYKVYILFGEPAFWLGFVMEPVSLFISGIMTGDVLSILFGILNVGFYVWAFIYTFHMVKDRRR